MGEDRPPLRIIAATRNPAKLRQFQRVVGALAVIEPLPDDISLPEGEEAEVEVAEDAPTNAEQKALAWSRVIGKDRFVMASDGGLTLPALGEYWDPSRTRRFAGAESTDLDRAHRLLRMASRLRGEQRSIGWAEALCIARNGQLVFHAGSDGTNGLLAPDVTPELIGAAGGFWVSAVWECPEYGGRRLAELTPEEREQRSDHWFSLGRILRPWLAHWRDEYGWT